MDQPLGPVVVGGGFGGPVFSVVGAAVVGGGVVGAALVGAAVVGATVVGAAVGGAADVVGLGPTTGGAVVAGTLTMGPFPGWVPARGVVVAGTVATGAMLAVVLGGAAIVVAVASVDDVPGSAAASVPADSTSPARTPVAVDGGAAVSTGEVASGTAEPTTVGAGPVVDPVEPVELVGAVELVDAFAPKGCADPAL